jgi:hypothetical protein
MDHVVYVDAKAKEMGILLSGEKTMIIRGAEGRKLPYGRVNSGDALYLINNNAEGVVKAKAKAKEVINSERMSKEESVALVEGHQDQLRLTARQFQRWAASGTSCSLKWMRSSHWTPSPSTRATTAIWMIGCLSGRLKA